MPIDTPGFPPIPTSPLYADAADQWGILRPSSLIYTLSPGAVPDCIGWFSGDSFDGTDDGSEIVTWPDSSNMRQDLTAVGSAGSRPTVARNGLGFRTAVRFNGTQRGLLNSSGTFTSSNTWTIYGVVQFDFQTSDTELGWISLGEKMRGTVLCVGNIGTATPAIVYTNLGGYRTRGRIVDTVWHKILVCCDAATETIYVDGSLQDWITAPGTNQAIAGGFRVGEQYDQNPQTPWKGKIAEVSVYNRALSTIEIAALHSYVLQKYGI